MIKRCDVVGKWRTFLSMTGDEISGHDFHIAYRDIDDDDLWNIEILSCRWCGKVSVGFRGEIGREIVQRQRRLHYDC